MKVKKLIEGTIASDFINPVTGTKFPKGSKAFLNSSINSREFGLFSMPKPNPIYFYLNFADDTIKNILEQRRRKKTMQTKAEETFELFAEVDYPEDYIYSIIQSTISALILLHSGLEAFLNQQIPADIEWEHKRKTKGEKWGKDKIQRYLSCHEKMKWVLILEQNKDARKKVKDWQNILVLNDLRNKVVHLKVDPQGISGNVKAYDEVYKDLLDVKIEELFQSVLNIINFYCNR